eukprot:1159276-Pelagomonas_calceolata.AAC.1
MPPTKLDLSLKLTEKLEVYNFAQAQAVSPRNRLLLKKTYHIHVQPHAGQDSNDVRVQQPED